MELKNPSGRKIDASQLSNLQDQSKPAAWIATRKVLKGTLGNSCWTHNEHALSVSPPGLRCCSSTRQPGKLSIAMIQKEKIEELLKLPAEERRRVLRLLQESLPKEDEAEVLSTIADQTSLAAKWLLSMAVVTQEDRVIPLPAPMRSSAARSISSVG